MIPSKIDLRNFKEFQPGNIIKLKYFEYYGRNTFELQRWVIETVFRMYYIVIEYVKMALLYGNASILVH